MENDVRPVITVEELCDMLMIGKNAAYNLLTMGEIKGFHIGRIWKIPRVAIDDYISKQSKIAFDAIRV